MLGELTAAEVKAKAKECGADIVGIAPMSRWEGTDKQHDPRYIFPGAKSMIVLGFRIPRGSLRGIEEGTQFLNYASMGYAALNTIYGPMVLWELNRFFEDHGYEAVPMANLNGGEAINPLTGNFRKGWSRPVRPGQATPDVMIHLRIAAYLCGLGEIENGLPLKVVAILASMPVAMNALIPPSLFDLDLDLANACWVFTTLELIVVLPILVIVLPLL